MFGVLLLSFGCAAVGVCGIRLKAPAPGGPLGVCGTGWLLGSELLGSLGGDGELVGLELPGSV